MKADIGTDIQKAAQLLQQGEVIAIPTETVYGLAANALNEEAVINIFKTKERPLFDPLIIHTSSIEKIKNYVNDFPAIARQLADAFWPGPLTLLLPKKNVIPDLVTSGLDQVAVRIPNHPLTLKLLNELNFPVAAPSANPFGYISPTTAQHVADQLGNKIPYILDGGAASVGVESTIIGFENGQTIVYRLGGLSLEKIEKVTGKVIIQANQSSNPKAPGMLKSHYAPSKPFILGHIKKNLEQYGEDAGVISFQQSYSVKHEQILSKNGNIEEAAKNLFSAMRTLDKAPVKIILAELLPEEGLGRAINDRLRRAAAE